MKNDLPRLANRTEDSTYDRIWKYYFLPDVTIKLTEQEEEIKNRWDKAWKLRGSIMSRTETVNKLIKDFAISKRTAYDDIKSAERLFGNPQDSNTAAEIAIATEILNKAARKAYKAGQYDVVEKIYGRISRINGWENKDNNLMADMIKKLKPHTIIFSSEPDALKKQAEELMKGADQVVEDIDFEDMDYDEAE